MVQRLRRATLGEFEIGRELGRGGMAAVFLAHEISLDRKVAIKVMSPGLLMGDGMIDRFKREAITIAHLNHPNIVSCYSVRQAEGLHFFVMRYIRGRSLEQLIHDAGTLPLPIVRSILCQVGSALTYAHRSRVVHRDIKPANILIDEDGNAVVTDFGIAKVAELPGHTHTGALVGTPAYMSPEQCSGAEVSGASDQYSLGAVAYEMVTGAAPFTGSTLTVMQAQVERTPPPIRDRCPDCPAELEAADPPHAGQGSGRPVPQHGGGEGGAGRDAAHGGRSPAGASSAGLPRPDARRARLRSADLDRRAPAVQRSVGVAVRAGRAGSQHRDPPAAGGARDGRRLRAGRPGAGRARRSRSPAGPSNGAPTPPTCSTSTRTRGVATAVAAGLGAADRQLRRHPDPGSGLRPADGGAARRSSRVIQPPPSRSPPRRSRCGPATRSS